MCAERNPNAQFLHPLRDGCTRSPRTARRRRQSVRAGRIRRTSSHPGSTTGAGRRSARAAAPHRDERESGELRLERAAHALRRARRVAAHSHEQFGCAKLRILIDRQIIAERFVEDRIVHRILGNTNDRRTRYRVGARHRTPNGDPDALADRVLTRARSRAPFPRLRRSRAARRRDPMPIRLPAPAHDARFASWRSNPASSSGCRSGRASRRNPDAGHGERLPRGRAFERRAVLTNAACSTSGRAATAARRRARMTVCTLSGTVTPRLSHTALSTGLASYPRCIAPTCRRLRTKRLRRPRAVSRTWHPAR